MQEAKTLCAPIKMASPQEMLNSFGGHGAERGPGTGVCGNFPPGGREPEGFKAEGSPFLRHWGLQSSHLYHEMLSCSPPPPPAAAGAQEAMREGRSFDPAQTKQLLLQNIPKTGLVGKAAVWRLMGNLTQRDPSGESMCAITVGREKKMKRNKESKKKNQ